jgi:hypothetical protein
MLLLLTSSITIGDLFLALLLVGVFVIPATVARYLAPKKETKGATFPLPSDDDRDLI